jgi:kumamolisin
LQADRDNRVPLVDSGVPVDEIPPTVENPHKAYISRKILTARERTEIVNFEVVLQMPNFAELQQRVAKGERISAQEMAAKYYPAAADYQKVLDWLIQEGFTIRRQDPSRMAVFASATVDQLESRLSMTFGRVAMDGIESTSAISAPMVPPDLASIMVGINGLQPTFRLHRHSLRRASTSGPGAPYEPGQLAQAYNASSLYTDNITGAGQTIAIVIDTFPLTSDLTTFWSDFGIDRGSGTVTFIQAVSGTLPAPSGEETLDTEWSSSIAPQANVRVYATQSLSFSDIDEGYEQVYSDVISSPSLAINQMSMSFGAAEYYVSGTQLTTDDQYFAELAAAGVTIFVSSGDVGATPTSSEAPGGRHLTPETPSSDPNVTGVGGTTLMVDANGNESSEVVWHNPYVRNESGIGATGGGISTYFSRPTSWQTGSTLPSSNMRLVPDVACAADAENGGYVILNGTTYEYGGTSWSSPTWAGFCALFNQACANAGKPVLGPLNHYLYPLIGTNNFRDITSGNNIYDSTQGYDAQTGYDLCTGCGAPNVTVLAQTLSGSSTLAPQLQSVASVKSHGGTNFSINLPLTGAEGVECRETSGTLQLVFTFIQPVVSGTATVTSGTATPGTITFSGDTMTVDLSDVTDAQNLTVTVSGINGTSASDSVTFGVLLGDVNQSGAVNAQDVTITRNAVGLDSTSTGFNPNTDVNESGAVNAQDVTIVRNAVGNSIP